MSQAYYLCDINVCDVNIKGEDKLLRNAGTSMIRSDENGACKQSTKRLSTHPTYDICKYGVLNMANSVSI